MASRWAARQTSHATVITGSQVVERGSQAPPILNSKAARSFPRAAVALNVCDEIQQRCCKKDCEGNEHQRYEQVARFFLPVRDHQKKNCKECRMVPLTGWENPAILTDPPAFLAR
jgi:hypothetical protein